VGIEERRKDHAFCKTEVKVLPIIIRKVTLILTEIIKKEAGFIWEGNSISLRH
jgi:hypothetical protein